MQWKPSRCGQMLQCVQWLPRFNACQTQSKQSPALQGWALENVVVPMARSYGLGQEYEYLRPSIQRFPTGPQQVSLARQAGFAKAVHYEIGFGLMGVLVATK